LLSHGLSLSPGLVLTALAVPMIVVITAAISLQPEASYATLAATGFLILTLALSAVNYVLLPLLGLGAVWVFRVGKRLYLVSLGYCEGKTIGCGGRTLGVPGPRGVPLESEYHGRLWIRIGYFPPRIHWVELPERGFFLRTRGMRALRGPYLPRNDERVLEMPASRRNSRWCTRPCA